MIEQKHPFDIHVINLDRSSDRLASFQATNGHMLPYITICSAVDGAKVDRSALVERGMIAADLGYKKGALGCALSHLALWDQAIKEERPFTVCEDDAVFNYSFCAASEKLLRELPSDWHLIIWGWNFDSMLWFDLLPGVSSCVGYFDQKYLRKGIHEFQSAKLRPYAFKLLQAFGTLCYSITPTGARLLLEHCLPLRNTSTYIAGLRRLVANTSLDIALNNVYSRTNSFVSFPPLVVTENDHSISTVQD